MTLNISSSSYLNTINKEFLSDSFLLNTKTSQDLFSAVKDLPIIDYHCHLPVDDIAADKKFENITQIWLYGDHYKWRAMRTNGINEKYITGDSSDWEKFLAWAETVPYTVRNPLYHWTHMELKNPFGISGKLLNKESAKEIWEHCNKLLTAGNFSARGILKHFNVEVVCTTDDPVDNLEHHKKISADNFSVKVLPAFRPDKGMSVESRDSFYAWLTKLQEITNKEIGSFKGYISAIQKRHDFFGRNGCRLSDHGIEIPYAEDYTSKGIESIFQKILKRKSLAAEEILKFKSAMMYEFALMDFEKGWVQQLHIGALRNNNSRMIKTLGPDTGFDSIGDLQIAIPLGKFLNKLDSENHLPKTIVYNLNPKDNEVVATMIGNFQDGTHPGKLQFGSAWWFLDQKDGIKKQLNALSNMGLLSRFVGMLTDSRSFLSYPRHEYFRRILCSMIGQDIENGLIPDSEDLIVSLVKNICYYNALNYFKFN
ncbi:MAG TPA: glucuronate isomerase [Ignavibacteriaceae bacterium]|nr:glucuronate isomerase [Ignavibacteriaceae bacterium]